MTQSGIKHTKKFLKLTVKMKEKGYPVDSCAEEFHNEICRARGKDKMNDLPLIDCHRHLQPICLS